jgi:hypothetical protein
VPENNLLHSLQVKGVLFDEGRAPYLKQNIELMNSQKKKSRLPLFAIDRSSLATGLPRKK